MALLRRACVPTPLLPPAFRTADTTDAELEPTRLVDIRTSGDHLTAVEAPGLLHAGADEPQEDLGGCIVFPGFVDCHVHLDKTFTWDRAPNHARRLSEAIQVMSDDKAHWTEEDILARADFALRCAQSHGTVALRTHLDTALRTARTSHAAIAWLRRQWAGRLTLQTVALAALEDYTRPAGEELADIATEHGAVALGAMPVPGAGLDRQLDRLLDLAAERRIGLDLHVDETIDSGAGALEAIARAVLRRQFPHPVVCGHVCRLALLPPGQQSAAVALAREAGLRIVTLPLANQFLQDRRTQSRSGRPGTPRSRGVTLVHELLDAGVTVAAASDNVRDAFHAWSDYDALEVLGQTLRIAHLDTRMAAAVTLVTSAAARVMELGSFGAVVPGARAALVVTEGRSLAEVFARPAGRRRIFTGGAFARPSLPSYAELDAVLRRPA